MRNLNFIASLFIYSFGWIPVMGNELPDVSLENFQSYEQITWPWQENSDLQKKRMEAVKKLQANGAKGDTQNVCQNPNHLLKRLIIEYEWDEWEEELLYVPQNITDELLMETLPYIPEIQTLQLRMVQNLTDEGVRTFQKLPFLEEMVLGTPSTEHYPLSVTSEGIKILLQLPKLKALTLYPIDFLENPLPLIGEYGGNLRHLGLTSEYFQVEELHNLGKLKNLKILTLLQKSAPPQHNSPSSAWTLFSAMKEIEDLESISLTGFNFSKQPPLETLQSIKELQRKRCLKQLFIEGTVPIHPFLMKELCQILSVKRFHIFTQNLSFTPDHPICYERVMYELYKKNAVPEYYQKLEKAFEEELKWHTWVDKKGEELKAKLVKIGKENVILEKEDGMEFTIFRSRLCKDDQLYLQELVWLEEDKKKNTDF